MQLVFNIRDEFRYKLYKEEFVIDKTGVKTIEITGANFIADEPCIFGTLNEEYAENELKWYKSRSLNVYDIPGKVPEIWKRIADEDGYINSNYGWCILSADNYNQFENVVKELEANPFSRRAQMIYTRPSMWRDYNLNGMSDFMCCSNTIHLIRNNKLETFVYFRSNDAVFGYKNDFHWMKYVHDLLGKRLNIELGDIHWNAASLHVYERHFGLVDD